MQYQKYDSYKDSELQWLDQVPQHWEVKKGKWIWKKENRPVRPDDDVITAFRDGMVTLRKNRREEGFTNSILEIGYQGIRKNDLVIHGMDAFAGAIGVSDSDGKSTPVYSACTPIQNANPFYFKYLLQSMSRTGYIEALARGIRERSTEFKFPQFANLEYPLPPVEEQQAIAEFIDKKTAQIDTHIDKQERLIALLKERRTAIINKAVTRGLDENVKLKDSGIDWLGDIPEHWEVKKLKYVIRNSTTQVSKMKPDDIYIEMENVESWTGKLLQYSTEANFDSTVRVFSEGDVLFGKLRPYLAKAVIAPVKGVCVGEFLVFKPSKKISKDYLHTLLLTKQFIDLIDSSTYGTKMPRANWDFIGNQYIPVPPATEQQLITHYIQEKNKKVDEAIAIVNNEITALKEYRQSLISNAVTGKIKVI